MCLRPARSTRTASPLPHPTLFRSVTEAGTRDFASPEEGDASPLAEALFGLGDVTGVFFGKDFVSVTAAPGVEWRGLKPDRSEEHTSELQSLMRISYAVSCLKKKNYIYTPQHTVNNYRTHDKH